MRGSAASQTEGRNLIRLHNRAIAGALIALGVASVAGQASAQPLEREHVHEVTSEVIEDFCGDLTVRLDVDVRISVLVNAHGRDGLVYFAETVHGTASWTNLANDKTFTRFFRVLNKDQRVTDNGDGTLTILVKGSAGTNGSEGRDFCDDIHEFIG